jgi:hypothetical protein
LLFFLFLLTFSFLYLSVSSFSFHLSRVYYCLESYSFFVFIVTVSIYIFAQVFLLPILLHVIIFLFSYQFRSWLDLFINRPYGVWCTLSTPSEVVWDSNPEYIGACKVIKLLWTGLLPEVTWSGRIWRRFGVLLWLAVHPCHELRALYPCCPWLRRHNWNKWVMLRR